MQVSGSAEFQRGEEVVVFASERNPDGSFDVRGMMMGKFNLEKDENGQEILVGPALSSGTHPAIRDHEEILRPGGTAQGQDDTSSVKRWTLEALRKLIAQQAEIVDLDANYPQGHSQIALNLLATGKAQEALPFFEKFAAMIPQSTLPKYQLCFAYVAVGRNDDARFSGLCVNHAREQCELIAFRRTPPLDVDRGQQREVDVGHVRSGRDEIAALRLQHRTL
jgi:hypothetical protein